MLLDSECRDYCISIDSCSAALFCMNSRQRRLNVQQDTPLQTTWCFLSRFRMPCCLLFSKTVCSMYNGCRMQILLLHLTKCAVCNSARTHRILHPTVQCTSPFKHVLNSFHLTSTSYIFTQNWIKSSNYFYFWDGIKCNIVKGESSMIYQLWFAMFVAYCIVFYIYTA